MVLYVCEHHSCWIPQGFKNVPNFKTGRMVLDLKVGEKKFKPFGWQSWRKKNVTPRTDGGSERRPFIFMQSAPVRCDAHPPSFLPPPSNHHSGCKASPRNLALHARDKCRVIIRHVLTLKWGATLQRTGGKAQLKDQPAANPPIHFAMAPPPMHRWCSDPTPSAPLALFAWTLSAMFLAGIAMAIHSPEIIASDALAADSGSLGTVAAAASVASLRQRAAAQQPDNYYGMDTSHGCVDAALTRLQIDADPLAAAAVARVTQWVVDEINSRLHTAQWHPRCGSSLSPTLDNSNQPQRLYAGPIQGDSSMGNDPLAFCRLTLAVGPTAAGVARPTSPCGDLPEPPGSFLLYVPARSRGEAVYAGSGIKLLAADAAGLHAGGGRLLRELRMPARGSAGSLVTVPDDLCIRHDGAGERWRIRGHQVAASHHPLQFRTRAEFAQFARDLAVFGTNQLELAHIPSPLRYDSVICSSHALTCPFPWASRLPPGLVCSHPHRILALALLHPPSDPLQHLQPPLFLRSPGPAMQGCRSDQFL